MKAAAVTAAAAVLVGGVSANRIHHRHAHNDLFEKRGHNESEICVPGCTTIWKTITGTAGLYTPPPPPPATATAWPTGPAVVPTPAPHVCPTPGTYTFPATTLVVTETTTVCAASTTQLPQGTHTIGGVTTVVETETTVVCPYATTKTHNGVVTQVLETTTYVCPSAGTYTIAPIVTTVTAPTVTVVVPVVTTYCPGTYTAPAVTTVVATETVVFCPFESETPAAPTGEVSPPKYTAPPAAVPTKPSSPAPGGLGGAGGKWAMTYTPYAANSECKSASEVLADVKKIAAAGFTTLRVYSTDCDTLPNVGAAAKECGLKLIIGVFIGAPGCSNNSPDVAKQISDIKAWGQWDLVKLVVVANEALFNGFCTVGQLKDLILHTKSELGGAGYSGPYTTTDVVSAWLDKDVSSICEVIDVVACNAHAYFNAGTRPADAGSFVAGQLKLVEEKCGKSGYVMETGWPTAGVCNGVACAGVQEQATAIASIKEAVGDKVVFFSASDDPWKAPGACNCEQHWGCGQLFAS
jgi:exo-beta-1,3-glucanase (GH17 family)